MANQDALAITSVWAAAPASADLCEGRLAKKSEDAAIRSRAVSEESPTSCGSGVAKGLRESVHLVSANSWPDRCLYFGWSCASGSGSACF